MTIAAKKAIDWAFENTSLNRIQIVAAIGNGRSQRIADKVGAYKDAVLGKRIIIGGKP